VSKAGFYYDGEFNDLGDNGNVWSSVLNSDNPNNSFNLNFNSDNVNPENNNNRYNAYSVRGVKNFDMTITREQLYYDLLKAFYDARKHKTKKFYVINFENNLSQNIQSLTDELYERRYKHDDFTSFVAKCTQPREVFAAKFRDRVVNHLYFNYLHEYFERTFIVDSYSCIKHRGTSYGVQRLGHHIRSESNNYQEECYALKIDIRAYFININRKLLKEIVVKKIDSIRDKHPETLDYDLLFYLTDIIINLDPTKNVKIRGTKKDWSKIPKHKSLFFAKLFCGLPIGDLTSQLFSNTFLNELDQFIKRVLKVKHYGRYVDDAFIIHKSKAYLRSLIPIIECFLKENLQLELHRGKTKIINVKYGVEFLGAFIKPFRIYIANQSLKRMLKDVCNYETNINRIQSLISKIGLLRQYKTYNIREKIFKSLKSSF